MFYIECISFDELGGENAPLNQLGLIFDDFANPNHEESTAWVDKLDSIIFEFDGLIEFVILFDENGFQREEGFLSTKQIVTDKLFLHLLILFDDFSL